MSTINPPDPGQCAVYLKAIADPTRLRILNALKAGPLTVGDIALSLEIEAVLASHHLRALYHAKVAVAANSSSVSDDYVSGSRATMRSKPHDCLVGI